ncbi:MAG: tRNA pseudouridine(38-40) synthase TruA [Sediminibacterium sp.]|nr:tRNA pseudouridine(38-40) synthase TruA [Sediminibacterium sp.]
MNRYLIELTYIGTHFAGFQTQKNAHSIQDELTKALKIITNTDIILTGSSRTDSGVHAKQNFFHFDSEYHFTEKHIYKLNAIISPDISCKRISGVAPTFHCRFDATARRYVYRIHRFKNPFINNISYYFPYVLNAAAIMEATELIKSTSDFKLFSKKHTDVKHFNCQIHNAEWVFNDQEYFFTIQANRFLRGMVKGIVGTLLLVGREKLSVSDFKNLLQEKNNYQVDFSPPSKGLCLEQVIF